MEPNGSPHKIGIHLKGGLTFTGWTTARLPTQRCSLQRCRLLKHIIFYSRDDKVITLSFLDQVSLDSLGIFLYFLCLYLLFTYTKHLNKHYYKRVITKKQLIWEETSCNTRFGARNILDCLITKLSKIHVGTGRTKSKHMFF